MRRRDYTEEEIARVCHEANSGLQGILNDAHPSGRWEVETAEVKASTVHGVRYAIECDPTPEEHHQEWVSYMTARGWHYGRLKDDVTRTHPQLRPWGELEPGQQDKDRLFLAVVRTLRWGGS